MLVILQMVAISMFCALPQEENEAHPSSASPSMFSFANINTNTIINPTSIVDTIDDNDCLFNSVDSEEYEEHIRAEFTELQRFSKEYSENQTFHEALSSYNELKNRYCDILPFDQTRVKLQDKGIHGSDYINANIVQFSDSHTKYISCQAPIPDTFYDFWWMMWEQKASVIVMLTKIEEKGKIKAHRYWPHKGERLHFGNLVVSEHKTKTINEQLVMKSFYLDVQQPESGLVERREIYHLQFTEWPDMGVPTTSKGIRNVMKLAHICLHAGAARGQNGPLVVHCSAGVGRTGTFIAIDHGVMKMRRNLFSSSTSDDHLMKTLHNNQTRGCRFVATPMTPDQSDEVHHHKREMDDCSYSFGVADIVKTMRTQRAGMVQTLDQYAFIYTALRECRNEFSAGNRKSSLLRKRKASEAL